MKVGDEIRYIEWHTITEATHGPVIGTITRIEASGRMRVRVIDSLSNAKWGKDEFAEQPQEYWEPYPHGAISETIKDAADYYYAICGDSP